MRFSFVPKRHSVEEKQERKKKLREERVRESEVGEKA